MAEGTGESPPKRTRYNYEDTITVIIGAGNAERTFTVHKDTICARSPYFEAACSARWTEGRDGIVRLRTHDPEYFELYTHWAYTGNVDMSILSEPPGAPGTTILFPSYRNLSKAWAFANYLQDKALRNCIIDEVVKRANATFSIVCSLALQDIWDITPANCTLRRLLVQIMVCRAKSSSFDKYADIGPRRY